MKKQTGTKGNLSGLAVIILGISVLLGCNLTGYFAEKKEVNLISTRVRMQNQLKLGKFVSYSGGSEYIKKLKDSPYVWDSYAPAEFVKITEGTDYTERAEKMVATTVHVVLFQFETLEDAKKYLKEEFLTLSDPGPNLIESNSDGEFSLIFNDPLKTNLSLGKKVTGRIKCDKNAFCYYIASEKENTAIRSIFIREFTQALPKSLVYYEKTN
jgi:hypothetical protein